MGWIVTSHLQDLSTEHIPHAYSAQTVLKSNMNKLGLLEKDEIITDDMIDIMATMQQYCPRTESRKVVKIPFEGWWYVSCYVFHCQKSKNGEFQQRRQTDRSNPKPEDWHESVMILQASEDLMVWYLKVTFFPTISGMNNAPEWITCLSFPNWANGMIVIPD